MHCKFLHCFGDLFFQLIPLCLSRFLLSLLHQNQTVIYSTTLWNGNWSKGFIKLGEWIMEFLIVNEISLYHLPRPQILPPCGDLCHASTLRADHTALLSAGLPAFRLFRIDPLFPLCENNKKPHEKCFTLSSLNFRGNAGPASQNSVIIPPRPDGNH